VHLDLGSGDGRGPYTWARQAPHRLFLATDANADSLAETAYRASCKPARGGVSNLICIAEPFDVIASELAGIANRVSVILPWGSLLRGLVAPEVAALEDLRRVCSPDADLELVFSYDPKRNAGEKGPLGAVGVEEFHVRNVLRQAYRSVGLPTTSIETINAHELRKYPTTWAKRLGFGRERQVWRIRATVMGDEAHA
jgi:16S rRNA (adenine(1408)-N(1))-methyltransferase